MFTGSYGNYNSPTKGSKPGGFLGGAMNSPSVGGNENQGKINCIFTATASQLQRLTESEGKFVHHSREVTQVRVLGMITDVRAESTRHIYTLQDMTGEIEINQFLDADNAQEMSQMQQITEGNWVVVLGNLKNFQGKRSVTAYRLLPVRDPNEITTHILECIDANMYWKKLEKNAGVGGGSMGDAMQVDSMGLGLSGGMSSNYANSGLTPLQQQLVMSISGCHDERGLSIHDMISMLSNQYKERDIRGAVDFLVQEGHIYSSIDDEHFLTTS